MNLEEKDGTTILHQTADKKPTVSWRTFLIGRPLATADAPHEAVGKLIGLAVFASDALSSTAYATQEMLVILALGGAAALGYSIPISFAIVGLLAILTISYEQTIHAYPGGGGAYIVARDNLGELPALVAAAALLTDYILTVSVSISSGVAQLVSAIPSLFEYRVEISVAFIFLVMLINLRGVRESGMAFSIPSYFFVIIMYITVVTGLVRYVLGTLGVVSEPPEYEMIGQLQPVTIFLILRAFASGTSAVTGVEAISNGITAFKEPRSKNAGITLIWMSCILGSLLLGITFLSHQIQAVPSEFETVISQLGRTIFAGRGVFYMMLIIATTVILVMAANTAYAGFPRLGAIVAVDGFLPRQLAFRGDRLVFSRGIVVLAVIASILVVIFQASVTNLIPLYAIGVFMSFTLAQAGMARRWWKSGHMKPGEEKKEHGSTVRYENGWQLKMVINGFGAITTSIVAVVFAIAKFADGAWMVLILIPILVVGFSMIHRHYRGVARNLTLEQYGAPAAVVRHRVIIPIAGVHRGTLAALRYARNLSDDVTAVHVSIDAEDTDRLKKKWEHWGEGVRLVILDSPYRIILEPLMDYIEAIDRSMLSNEMITIVVPQFVPHNRWSNFLHTRTADTLRKQLLVRKEIVITEVPYQME